MLTGEQHRPAPLAYVKATALSIARRYLGTRELDGPGSNPQILAWLARVVPWANDDEVPWCSAFVYAVAELLELERPGPGIYDPTLRRQLGGPAAARSWLTVGEPVPLERALPGFDVVVLKRGGGDQPGPEVLAAPGHVGFLAGWTSGPRHEGAIAEVFSVSVLAGNQGDAVSVREFPVSQILGIRRLRGAA